MSKSWLMQVLRTLPLKRSARRQRKAQRPLSAMVELLEPRRLMSATPVTTSAALHVAGTQLENSSGQVIQLRGVNIDGMEGWGNPNGGLVLPQADVQSVQAAETAALTVWHADLIRLPVNQDFWLGLDPGVNKTAYIADIDAIVKQASSAGAYVMLDVQASDGGTGNPKLEGSYSLPDTNTTAFWKSAAAHYVSNSAVLFDLFNEPGHFVANYSQWKTGASKFTDEVNGHQVTYSSPGLQGLITAIRSVSGSKNIIAAEGMGYADDFSAIGSAIAQGNGLSDSAKELMYSAHLYPSIISSASNISQFNNLLPSTVTSNYPVYIGEWGADNTTQNPDWGTASPNATVWNQDMLNWLSTKPYSWTAWAMNAEPWLTTQGTTTPTSYFGQLVENYLIQHNGASSPSVSVQFQDTDDWGSGFVGYITITNTGTAPINGWTLEFSFTGVISPNPNPAKLTNIWNATWLSHTGNEYLVENDSTDTTIAPGKSISFGFVATWANPHSNPSNFVLK